MAVMVELDFGLGARSKVHIADPDAMRQVMERAQVRDVRDLIGHSWSVLNVRNPQFGVPVW
jgi:hypothetical protein